GGARQPAGRGLCRRALQVAGERLEGRQLALERRDLAPQPPPQTALLLAVRCSRLVRAAGLGQGELRCAVQRGGQLAPVESGALGLCGGARRQAAELGDLRALGDERAATVLR